MARTVPWYFPNEGVYHNNTDCMSGGSRQGSGFVDGTSGRRLCPECMTLNALNGGAEQLPKIPAARRVL